jgi:hypothetical protein
MFKFKQSSDSGTGAGLEPMSPAKIIAKLSANWGQESPNRLAFNVTLLLGGVVGACQRPAVAYGIPRNWQTVGDTSWIRVTQSQLLVESGW